MNCRRCRGLMCAVDFLVSATTAKDEWRCGWRCIICGEIIDPVIVWNRMRTKPQRLIREKQKPARRLFRTLSSSLSSGSAQSNRR